MNVGENSKILYGPQGSQHRLMRKPTVAEYTRVMGIAPLALYDFQEGASPVVNKGTIGTSVNIVQNGTRLFGKRIPNTPWHGVLGEADGNDGYSSAASAALAPSTWGFGLAVIFNPNIVPANQDNHCALGIIDSGGVYIMVRSTSLRNLQFLCRDGTNTKIVSIGTLNVNDRRPLCIIAGYDPTVGLFYAGSNRHSVQTLAAGSWNGYVGANLTVRATNYAASSNSENVGVAWGAWSFGFAFGNSAALAEDRLRKFGWK